MRYRLERTVAPTDLVVSLAEAKTFLAVSHDAHDDLITDIIKAATDFAETYTNMVLPQATYKMYLDDFYDILIPRAPIIEILSVQYYNSSDSLQTLDSGYEVDLISYPAQLHWDNTPTVRDYEFNNVVITFTAGFADVADVPSGIKMRIRNVISDLYDQRSTIHNTNIEFDPSKYAKLFAPVANKFYL